LIWVLSLPKNEFAISSFSINSDMKELVFSSNSIFGTILLIFFFLLETDLLSVSILCEFLDFFELFDFFEFLDFCEPLDLIECFSAKLSKL